MTEGDPTAGRAAKERQRMDRLRARKASIGVDREAHRLDVLRQRSENRQLPKHVRDAVQETGGNIVAAVEKRQEEDRESGAG